MSVNCFVLLSSLDFLICFLLVATVFSKYPSYCPAFEMIGYLKNMVFCQANLGFALQCHRMARKQSFLVFGIFIDPK